MERRVNPKRIVVLDDVTANKIAAGEVIERPASVVKELVENAVDAGSTKIDVEVFDGGLAEIVVSDNGWGMIKDDAVLAFQRHATSKIRTADDLFRVESMGFRGEALPSIAAVAKVEMTTRVEGEQAGSCVKIEGGKLISVTDTGCPQGTCLRVKDLFWNTPARKKYLKTVAHEFGLISDLINRLALAYPWISFSLKHNNRLIFQSYGNNNLLENIVLVYGKELAREMLPLRLEKPDFSIEGFIGKPSIHRRGRTHQSFFINNRYIKSGSLRFALERGYATFLPVNRYPVAVIKLTLPPDKVDVNVHPTKQEVKLELEREIMRALETTVRQVLTGSCSPKDVHLLVDDPPGKELAYDRKIGMPQPFLHVKEQTAIPFVAPPYNKGLVKSINNSLKPSVLSSSESQSFATGGQGSEKLTGPICQLPLGRGNPEILSLFPLGQLDSTYIIAQGPEGMYLIDQHAAHERILYEELKEKLSGQSYDSQSLVVPISLELTHQEADLLGKHLHLLETIGYSIEPFGKQSFLLRAVPAFLPKGEEKGFLLDLLDLLFREGVGHESELREKAITFMACRGAIKANQPLSLREMEELLYQLAGTVNPLTCPHGRPIWLFFSYQEIQKKFKRL